MGKNNIKKWYQGQNLLKGIRYIETFAIMGIRNTGCSLYILNIHGCMVWYWRKKGNIVNLVVLDLCDENLDEPFQGKNLKFLNWNLYLYVLYL